MILTLAVSGYRSVRDLVLPLGALNVVTGANGSGKSSLYRALRLLGDIGQGRIIGSLAAEGGLSSTLWAGPEQFSRSMLSGDTPVQGTRRNNRIALKLGFASEDYGYAIDLGLPKPSGSAFSRDPEIKAEAVWAGEALSRRNVFASRNGPLVKVLDAGGKRVTALDDLKPFDSMLTHAADPRDALELLLLRERMRSWRFYDHFRTDTGAPARQSRVGTRTPVLASDGSDLAAAIQTIVEIGDHEALAEAIDDAFEGSRIEVSVSDGRFELHMHQPGLLRPLHVSELSDGTLRFLLLVAALLSPRPAALLVLNEPETSLHPDLIGPLGRLIARASRSTQIITVSHSRQLVEDLSGLDECTVHRLQKRLGETIVPDAPDIPWTWPAR